MLNFKKPFNLRLISLALILVFMLDSFLYGMGDRQDKSCLRIPLMATRREALGLDRLKAALKRIFAVRQQVAAGNDNFLNPRMNRRKMIKTSGLITAMTAMPWALSGDKPASIPMFYLLANGVQAAKKPYLDREYFISGYNIYAQDGERLGYAASAHCLKIVKIDTKEVIGWFDWYMLPEKQKVIFDITGRPIKFFINGSIYDEKEEPLLCQADTGDGIKRRVGYFVKEFRKENQRLRWYFTDLDGKRIASIEPARLACVNETGTPDVRAIVDIESLSHHFFKSKPSMELYEELRRAIEEFEPSDASGKIIKIELVRRLMEIEIESGIIPDIEIKKRDVLKALHSLNNIPIEDLRNLTDEAVWDAISNLHPQCRLYVEAAKRLGFDKDAEVLYRSLLDLKKEFKHRASDDLSYRINVVGDAGDIFDEATKDIFSKLLLFNSLSAPEQIILFMNNHFHKPLPLSTVDNYPRLIMERLIDRAIYEDAKEISTLDFAHAEAIVLQREGYESYLAIGCDVKESKDNKIPGFEYFVIFRDKASNNWYAIDTNGFISKKGLKVEKGLYKINDIKDIGNELNLKNIYKISANQLSFIPRSLKEYLKIQDNKMPKQLNFDDLEPSFFSSFRFSPFIDWETRSHLAIRDTVEAENIKLFEAIVKKYEIQITNGEDMEGYMRNMIMTDFVISSLLLPEKFMFSLRQFGFVKELKIKYNRAVSVDSSGTVIQGPQDYAAGLYMPGKQEIQQAASGVGITIHELIHNWGDVVPDEIKNIFYSISWDKDSIKGKADLDNFVRIDAMTNRYEDLADTGKDYVTQSEEARNKVRKSMEKGKFELAVKYLFVKYVILKDFDGKFFEYEIDEKSLPVTIDEVETAMEGKAISPNLLEAVRKIRGLVFNGDVYGNVLDEKMEMLKYLAATQWAI